MLLPNYVTGLWSHAQPNARATSVVRGNRALKQLLERDIEIVDQSPQVGHRSGHEMTPTFSLPFSDIAVTFNPQPWKSGPSGYIASTSQPKKYSCACGPGTLEMFSYGQDFR